MKNALDAESMAKENLEQRQYKRFHDLAGGRGRALSSARPREKAGSEA